MLTQQEINQYLESLGKGHPTLGGEDPFLAKFEAYLENSRPKRETLGQIVIVIGTGRCGSTSITDALKMALPDSLMSHERPPLIHWNNADKRIEFHIEFMRIARRYYAYVGDVSHWWLPHLNIVENALGSIKVIFLKREFKATLESFVKLKNERSTPFNHWIDHAGRGWFQDPWDPCYPKLLKSHDVMNYDDKQYKNELTRFCIAEYISSYHLSAQRYIDQQNGLTLELEHLFSEQSGLLLSQYLGYETALYWQPTHLNQNASTEHSANMPLFA
ncbi:hypothetical protein N480_17910 [Pseudoalteromonas luteoviolacea S2607]|uniref:hypothetical protein n=1 Tax=Pseudoalteromonas luteoviolacea TaxID=43657 RepID=UPI0007B04E99|nr:hypothetical protein [Pseudoalteromonas luteoviolacea]KZN36352.1 hypothetical protein N480_17910 [Pseudoalteromonas luteoviolacea S2607]